MKLLIKNIRPLVTGKIQQATDVLLNDNKIYAIGAISISGECETIDGGGRVLAAGFIDIHTHGGYGHDIMEATEKALIAAGTFHLDNGTTSYCPTTLTASPSDTQKALTLVKKFIEKNAKNPHSNSIDNVGKQNAKNKTSRIVGVHLEGPYLSPKAAGAHPQNLLLDPDKKNTDFIWKNSDIISRITLAPNLSGAVFLTKECKKRGIQVSLGHDNSIDEEINRVLCEGASSVTHLYNCTSRPSRRTTPKKYLGLTEVALIDNRITAEVIADDRHVPNALFEMIFKLKGKDGIALVSDSLSVAGQAAGDYYLGSGESKQVIRVEDGVATLPSENTYAGSVTPISKMVENLVANTCITLEEALCMGSHTPSKLLNLTDRGDIKEGMLADLNIFSDDGKIVTTIFGGEILAR